MPTRLYTTVLTGRASIQSIVSEAAKMFLGTILLGHVLMCTCMATVLVFNQAGLIPRVKALRRIAGLVFLIALLIMWLWPQAPLQDQQLGNAIADYSEELQMLNTTWYDVRSAAKLSDGLRVAGERYLNTTTSLYADYAALSASCNTMKAASVEEWMNHGETVISARQWLSGNRTACETSHSASQAATKKLRTQIRAVKESAKQEQRTRKRGTRVAGSKVGEASAADLDHQALTNVVANCESAEQYIEAERAAADRRDSCLREEFASIAKLYHDLESAPRKDLRVRRWLQSEKAKLKCAP